MRRLLGACVVIIALSAQAASAETIIFSNLGPGGTFHPTNGTFFGFDTGEEGDPSTSFSRAMEFVPSFTATLRTIEMPLEFPFSFSDGTLEVNLFAAADDGLPGAVLESFTSTAPTGSGLTVFESVARPRLQAGLTYFLEARTLGQADGIWLLSLVELQQLERDVFRVNGGAWNTGSRDFAAAYRISGDLEAAPVPEPATLTLLAVGLGLGAWRRRQEASRKERT